MILGLGLLLSLSRPVEASPSRVTLDGNPIEVRWSDGDSFRILSGRLRGNRARLLGYNTLESYGPVHKWGDWNGWQLYKIAKDATLVAQRENWECKSELNRDRYKRLLIRCPKLIEAMIDSGYGHLFEISKDPDPKLIARQKEAIKARKGMWAKGAPIALMTSVHSLDEGPEKVTYNRLVKIDTGRANKLLHQKTYATCDLICHEGSCLLYVPYQLRYGDARPDCLKWSGRDR
jgi:micrococcal nuclease